MEKEMIENLVVAFEQNKISIDNDENLLRELAGFTVSYNPATQTVKYDCYCVDDDDEY